MLVFYLRSTTHLTEQQIEQALHTPEFLDRLEPVLRKVVAQAYASALDWVFVAVAICGAVGLVASLLLTGKKIMREEDERDE